MSSEACKHTDASSSTAGASVQTPQAPTSTSVHVQSQFIQEKNILASLNDRLAAYIDRNQKLENENAAMKKQLDSRFQDLTAERDNLAWETLEAERNGLLTKIKDLENKIDLDHARFASLLNDRDNEIDRLVMDVSDLVSALQDEMKAVDSVIPRHKKKLKFDLKMEDEGKCICM